MFFLKKPLYRKILGFIAALGIEPKIRGKHPLMIPFHYTASGTFLFSLYAQKTFGEPTPIGKDNSFLWKNCSNHYYSSFTVTVIVCVFSAVEVPTEFVAVTVYVEEPAVAVDGVYLASVPTSTSSFFQE